VPADYYFHLNYFQKIWHEWKWLILKHLIIYEKSQLHDEPVRILEVGSAGGHLTNLTGTLFPFAKIIGIDVYAPAVEEAKKRFPKYTFKVADAHKLPFKTEEFDIVICSETIEHVVDPGKVLSEIRRVLKESGALVIEMDSGSVLFRLIWWAWTQFGSGRVWKNAHLHPFKAQELEELILKSGFKIKKKVFSHFGMAVSFLVTKT
jgi:ubiquinone/menaquinone biosynthesis C-methylase UbiE